MVDAPLKQRFVLDTSLFLSGDIRRDGEDLEAAVARLLDTVAAAKIHHNISCYIAPTVHRELVDVLADRDIDPSLVEKLNTWVIRKHPARYELLIPAEIVQEFIHEMSGRVNRGLRVSEAAVRKAGSGSGDGNAEAVLAELRQRYRTALRQGVLDSREDFDLLILARELDAGIVTEDTGILGWAEEFGLRYVRGRDFPELLEAYLSRDSHRP
jgi:hypothetical protein